MGEVHLAEDPVLGRKVALKFLPPELEARPDRRARFLREARAAAGLDHPYICKIYEVGELGGRSFIAMEYVQGETLAERIGRGPLDVDEAVRLATEMLEALDRAHQDGIVHRDLKPANVMVAEDGHAKVLDFGLAKREAGPAEPADARTLTELTRDGVIVGTPAYMSPEQARGQHVDARSDLFAVGVVLHEMLTGVHPFLGPTPADTTSAILTREPPPLARLRADLPGPLAHVARKLLAKEVTERFQSAREVLENLESIRRDGSRRTPRARWLRVGALAGLALAGGALAWWLVDGLFGTAKAALGFRERDWILIADVVNGTGEEVFDHSLDAALGVSLEQSRYVNVFPRSRVHETLRRMRREDLDRIDEAVGREIALREGVRALLVASIDRVGRAYALAVRLVDPDTGVTVLSRSTTVAGQDEVLGALDELGRAVRRELGESLAGVAERSVPLPRSTTSSLEALKLYADARRLPPRDAKIGFDLLLRAAEIDPEFAMAHAEIGRAYHIRGDGASGDRHFRRALDLLDRLTLREQLWIRANVEDWRGNREAAIESYGTYLAQYPDDLTAWFRLGYAYLAAHQLDTCIDAFEHVLHLDDSEPSALINIATCLNGLGRSAEALPYYEKAFTIAPDRVTDRGINHEYGFTLVALARFDEATATFGKMLEHPEPGLRARGHRSLALMEMYRGRYAAAIPHLEQAARLNRAAAAPLSEFRDNLYLATVYRATGRTTEFETELRAARAYLAAHNVSPEWIGPVGKIEARTGRTDDARRLLADLEARLGDPTTIGSVTRSNQRNRAVGHVLRGEIALALGHRDEALEQLTLAANLDESLTLESLARCHAVRGEIDAAIASYEKLRVRPSLGEEAQQDWVLSHYELGRLYEQKGDGAKAVEVYQAFLRIWSEADPNLVGVADARNRMAKLGAQRPAP